MQRIEADDLLEGLAPLFGKMLSDVLQDYQELHHMLSHGQAAEAEALVVERVRKGPAMLANYQSLLERVLSTYPRPEGPLADELVRLADRRFKLEAYIRTLEGGG